VQLVAPVEPMYLPASQELQLATPALALENLPTAHDRQVEAPLAAEVLFPGTQAMHTVAPVVATYLPATQVEHASSPVSAVY